MKIGLGNDHHGVLEKSAIISHLEKREIEYIDFGTRTTENVDYVDYAVKVSNAVNSGEIDKGIIICGTGIGMCMAANKIKGIRCAKVSNEDEAKLTREHNDANVLAISAHIEEGELIEIVNAFIDTPFSNEERHRRRVDKLNNL